MILENLKRFYMAMIGWIITIICALPGFALMLAFATIVIIYAVKEVNAIKDLLW